MHESGKWKWSRSVMSDSTPPHGPQPTRLLHPWDFPGKSSGVGCHCLLCFQSLRRIKKWQLSQRLPLVYKTQHHPITSSTLCRMLHLNNKENKNTNQIISRQNYHLTQPCPSGEKQTNKNSEQISPYVKLTQTTGPTLGGQKPKWRKNSTFFKERVQLSLKPGKRRPQTQ